MPVKRLANTFDCVYSPSAMRLSIKNFAKATAWLLFWLVLLPAVALVRYSRLLASLVILATGYGVFVWWLFNHAR